ncbi:MAG: hypothetical protein ACREVL_19800 [Solimonas sp.]
MRILKCLAAAMIAAAVALAAPAQAADLPDLRVEYLSWSIGADGARQQLSYSERVIRQDGQMWIEREIPEAVQRRHDTHGHASLGHKHADVAGAPLWIRRSADGRLDVQLVDRHERRLIQVGEPNYGNVGFGGHWNEAYHLLEPADLARLKAVGTATAGVQRYELKRDRQTLRVVWDSGGQYAREIVSEDSQGLGGRTIRATTIAAPQPLPWATLKDYAARDYSDLLD